MIENNLIKLNVPDEYKGQRVDKTLAALLPDYSRSMIQKWLKESLITVDDEITSQKQKVYGGEEVQVIPQSVQEYDLSEAGEEIPLEIIFEDDDVLVVNKPVGLVVHPGAGMPNGTLLNALIYHDESLALLPRAGIVHRLDKDTSGLMVVAKNEKSRITLIEQLQNRTVSRTYYAIVNGVPIAGGTIDKPIARHKRERVKMAAYDNFGKEAITHFRVENKFFRHALLKVNLETGRTHQIRVHMSDKGHALIGDKVYGGRLAMHSGMHEELQTCLRSFKRQALHAAKLAFIHPSTKQEVEFSCEFPQDINELLEALTLDFEKNARR